MAELDAHVWFNELREPDRQTWTAALTREGALGDGDDARSVAVVSSRSARRSQQQALGSHAVIKLVAAKLDDTPGLARML